MEGPVAVHYSVLRRYKPPLGNIQSDPAMIVFSINRMLADEAANIGQSFAPLATCTI